MKKKILLSILALLALCSCNNTGGSETSTPSSETSNSLEEENGWADDIKQAMREHLHNEVLPYIEVGKTKAQYDSASDKLYILGLSTVSKENLDAYATAYSEDKGWTKDTASLTDTYAFQKKVKTEQGDRYVNAKFWAADTTTLEPTDEGIFVLIANDPYEYAFPKAMFDDYLKNQVGSKLQVPEFKADYYEVNQKNHRVTCYTSDTNAEATYSATLKANGFTISSAKDDFYTVAESSDKKFVVKYVYISSRQFLDITVEKKLTA